MMRQLFGAVLLFAATACAVPAAALPAAPPAAPPSGAVTAASFTAFLGNGLSYSDRGSFGLDQTELVADPDAPGGQFLRVRYPAGSASRRSAVEAGSGYGGAQAYLPRASGPVDVLNLRYHVRFMNGFDFVKGGKLPGLYGGTAVSGGTIPDGTNGFSTRFMWRREGAGEVYAYLPSSVENGTSLGRGSWSFAPGEWTAVEQQVRLNTPGAPDGSVTVLVDGVAVLAETGIEFRTTDRLRIDGLFFSTFFGGGDPSWASPTDQYADFAAFTLSSDPLGPLVDR